MEAADSNVIRQCLFAAANGPFFPDWEFGTLFGLTRVEARQVAEEWPESDDERKQSVAVSNALNHLLGYPHKHWDAWSDYISATPGEVAGVLARWHGEAELDPSGQGYFDQLK